MIPLTKAVICLEEKTVTIILCLDDEANYDVSIYIPVYRAFLKCNIYFDPMLTY